MVTRKNHSSSWLYVAYSATQGWQNGSKTHRPTSKICGIQSGNFRDYWFWRWWQSAGSSWKWTPGSSVTVKSSVLHNHVNLYCVFLWVTVKVHENTVESWVSAYGRLNVTRDFGPHGRLPGIKISCMEAASDPLKFGTWALTRDTTVVTEYLVSFILECSVCL